LAPQVCECSEFVLLNELYLVKCNMSSPLAYGISQLAVIIEVHNRREVFVDSNVAVKESPISIGNEPVRFDVFAVFWSGVIEFHRLGRKRRLQVIVKDCPLRPEANFEVGNPEPMATTQRVIYRLHSHEVFIIPDSRNLHLVKNAFPQD
jgi:hypothetical protein